MAASSGRKVRIVRKNRKPTIPAQNSGEEKTTIRYVQSEIASSYGQGKSGTPRIPRCVWCRNTKPQNKAYAKCTNCNHFGTTYLSQADVSQVYIESE